MLTKSELKAWTDDLRANPHLQGTGVLYKLEVEKFCCLGRLCELQGLKKTPSNFYYVFPDSASMEDDKNDYSRSTLLGDLGRKFGSDVGSFLALNMPNLLDKGVAFESIAAANDAGVPWSVIADHLDRYYPAVGDPR